MTTSKYQITPEETEELLDIMKNRFDKNIHRHQGLQWNDVQLKLEYYPEKNWSLNEMKKTGGKPDVVDFDNKTN